MGNFQWLLELPLLLLLAATLFHAMRLERALGVLKRDRAVLEALVEGFNDSTRQAESGIERLRVAADGAGRQMARQTELAQKLYHDLQFLADRSDRLAERLETALRSARMFADSAALSAVPGDAPTQLPPLSLGGSFAGLAPACRAASAAAEPDLALAGGDGTGEFGGPAPRLRSQAERDLLRVLRAGR